MQRKNRPCVWHLRSSWKFHRRCPIRLVITMQKHSPSHLAVCPPEVIKSHVVKYWTAHCYLPREVTVQLTAPKYAKIWNFFPNTDFTSKGRDTWAGGGGSGGSCPPQLWNRGALPPPQLLSVNLLSFHHIYKLYKNVLWIRQSEAAKHIVSLSWAEWFSDKLDYFSLIRFIWFSLVAAQWY